MYKITIIGAETVLPYNRIMLSPVLAGEKGFDEIRTHDEAYFAQNNLFIYTIYALNIKKAS
jgi:nitrite reductase (NADH) large subunit